MYLSVHWVLLIQWRPFSLSEVSLQREDEPESPGETLVVLDKTDRERSSPKWLWFHCSEKICCGFRHPFPFHREIALHKSF